MESFIVIKNIIDRKTMTKESCLSSVWKRRWENFTCVVIKLLPFLLHCPPSLDIYMHDVGS